MRVPALPAPSATVTSPESPPLRPASRLADWESLTRDACHAQAAQRLEEALAGHVRALCVLEALLDGQVLRNDPDDCLAALVVSHHNLADLYRQRGQLLPAVEHTCAPHELLLRLAGDASSAVQKVAWRHLRQTRAVLLAWQRQHGAHPRIEECAHLWAQTTATARADYRH